MPRKRKMKGHIMMGPEEEPVPLWQFDSVDLARAYKVLHFSQKEWDELGYWIAEGPSVRTKGARADWRPMKSSWDPNPNGVPKNIQTSVNRVSEALKPQPPKKVEPWEKRWTNYRKGQVPEGV